MSHGSLRIFVCLAVLLLAAPAGAASPFADETRRAFTLSAGPYVAVGPNLAKSTGEPGGAVRLGAHVGFQPFWFATLLLDASFMIEGPRAIATSPGGQDVRRRLDVALLSPRVALRPPSGWIEASGGPVFALSSPLLVGAAARLAVLVPFEGFRLGPGLELQHLGGEGVRVQTLSAVVVFELGILERKVSRPPE